MGKLRTPRSVCMLLGVLLAAAALPGATPKVRLQTGFITPRSDISLDEGLIWRARLSVQHKINARFSWDLTGEIMPETITRPGGARLYSARLLAKIGAGGHLTLGRQVFWNNLLVSRFDGLRLRFKRGTYLHSSQWQLFGGVTPDMRPRTDLGQAGKPMAGASYEIGRGPNRYSAQVWTNTYTDESALFAGVLIRRALSPALFQIADASLNITDGSPERIRLRTTWSMPGGPTVFAGYRHSGRLSLARYTNLGLNLDSLDWQPRQTLELGALTNLSTDVALRIKLDYRLGDYSAVSVNSALYWRDLSLTARISSQPLYSGQYLQAAIQHRFEPQMQLGGAAGIGSYTLFDEDSPAVALLDQADRDTFNTNRELIALSGWMKGGFGDHLGYRLFGQYTRNRLFDTDGRIGLQVTYEL